MTAVSDGDSQLSMHPRPDGLGSVLLSSLTGESFTFGRPMRMAIDEHDDAYVFEDVEDPRTSIWVHEILQNGAFKDEETNDLYVEINNGGGQATTKWLDEMQECAEWRTLTFGTIDVAAKRYMTPRAGGQWCFLTVRDLLEGVDTSQWTTKYRDDFIANNWARWEAMAADIQASTEHMERSGKSTATRQRMAGQTDVTESSKEWMISAYFGLALMCRWAVQLSANARASIPGLLKSMITAAFPDATYYIFIALGDLDFGSTLPVSVAASDLRLSLVHGLLDCEPLLEWLPDLRAAFKKTHP